MMSALLHVTCLLMMVEMEVVCMSHDDGGGDVSGCGNDDEVDACVVMYDTYGRPISP